MNFSRWSTGAWQAVRWVAAWGSYDFCPWANRYVYWLKQPIGWFVIAAAASLLTALFLEPQAWLLFASLLAVIALGVSWPWLAMRSARAELRFDGRRCREGELVRVRLVIENRWPWPLWGLTVENGFFLSTEGASERPVIALARIAGWSRSEFVWEFHPPQRGVYPLVVPELVTGFPFGIWRASRPISVPRQLLVWPRTVPLTSIPALGGDIADIIGMLCQRPGSEGDVQGVRPFRHGDRLRSINWAQTARRDLLVVTERQAAARRLVQVTVDLAAFEAGASSSAADIARCREPAIRVAASIAREFHSHHAEVQFVLGSLDFFLSPDPTGWQRLMDEVAQFRGGAENSRPTGSGSRQALTIVVTTEAGRAAWDRGATAKGPLRLVLLRGRDRALPESEPAAVAVPFAKCAAQPRSPGQTPSGHGSGFRRHGRPGSAQVWMGLDGEGDYPLQLRQQWERVCHASLAN